MTPDLEPVPAAIAGAAHQLDADHSAEHRDRPDAQRRQHRDELFAVAQRAARRHRMRKLLAPAALILLGLILYLPGINWGLPAVVSWSQDSIAGARTLGAVEGWPRNWQGRYPPAHFLLLDSLYRPLNNLWQARGDLIVDPHTGEKTLREPQAPKVGLRILIARLASVAMAIAAGIGLWAASRRLLHDRTAAFLAAAAFMIGADFAYFAHLDNVDVPSICWLAWSLFFYVRLLQAHRLRDAALLGVFAALAVGTKDSVAGMFPGMALVLFVNHILMQRRDPNGRPSLGGALWQPHWLVGIATFGLLLLIINGAFVNFEGYAARLRYWLDPPPESLHAQQLRYGGVVGLLGATIWYAASAVGWPMLAAIVASTVYALLRLPRLAMICLVPPLGYFLIVLVPIDFVYARFLLAPLALLSILVGAAAAALLRTPHIAHPTRAMAFAVILLPSLAYTAAVNLELLTDSRYDCEAWFDEHVPRHASVGAFSLDDTPILRPQYLPRVHEMGYPTYPVVMAREWFDRPQPEYLILTNYTYEDFDEHQRACLKELLDGSLGYVPVVAFTGRFLGTGSSWLSLAGWGAPIIGKISPTLTVLRRREDAHQSLQQARPTNSTWKNP